MLDTEKLELTTFVIGPEAGGRGYRLMGVSGALPSNSCVRDFSLMLLGWAKTQPDLQTYSYISARDGAYITKFKYIEEGSFGPIAYAHGVYVTNEQLEKLDFRIHNIAALLQEDITIAQTYGYKKAIGIDPLHVSLSLLNQLSSNQKIEVPLGVALTAEKHKILISRDLIPLKVLSAVMDSMPLEVRKKIKTWVAGNEVASNGSIIISNRNLFVSPDRGIRDGQISTVLARDANEGYVWKGDLTEETDLTKGWAVFTEILKSRPEYAPALNKLTVTEDMKSFNVAQLFRNLIIQTSRAPLNIGQMTEFLCDCIKSKDRFLRGVATTVAKDFLVSTHEAYDLSKDGKLRTGLTKIFSERLAGNSRREILVDEITRISGVEVTPSGP